MNSDLLNVLATLATGCLVSIAVAVFNFHARFIRMEDGMRTIRRDVTVLKRIVNSRLPHISVHADWDPEDKEDSGDQ